MLAGIALGYASRGRLSRVVERLLVPNVALLVAVMGVGAGSRVRGGDAASILYGGIAAALIPSAMSLLVALALVGPGRPRGGSGQARARGPWLALFSLLAGSTIGYYAGAEPPGILVDLLLYILLLLSGYMIGGMEGLFNALRGGGSRGVLLAVSCIVGGAAGGALAGALVGWGLVVGALMGAASGWYSLAGPLLYLVDPLYGAAAFLGNLFREMLHIMIYPLLARRIPLAAIAVGGATTMDTGLPVVAAYGGVEERIAAFVQGALLTLALSLGLPLAVSLA